MSKHNLTNVHGNLICELCGAFNPKLNDCPPSGTYDEMLREERMMQDANDPNGFYLSYGRDPKIRKRNEPS